MIIFHCKIGHRRNMIHTTFDGRFNIFPFYLDTIFHIKLVILFFSFEGIRTKLY